MLSASFLPQRWRFVPFMLVLGLLGACQSPYSKTVPLTSELLQPQSPNALGAIRNAFLAPGGNYSMVTVRNRPDIPGAPTSPSNDILCTAPSPDWATAVAMAQQIQGSGGVTGGPSASLAANSSLTETISALAGRTAGVVALRDGLYKACEAYANGVIGKDAYALILSQYGTLLVALAGGSGSGGSAPSTTPASSTPSGLAVAVSTGATPSASGAGSTPPSSSNSQAGNAVVAQLQQEMLQALLVACISESDPTVHPPAQPQNLLLQNANACPAFIQSVIHQAPALLAVQSASPAGNTGGQNKSAGIAADSPNPGVAEMQTLLNTKCHANIKPDGRNGPETKAALAAAAAYKC